MPGDSPAKAFAEQAKLEVQVERLLIRQMRSFLSTVLASTLANRFYTSAGEYAYEWEQHMGADALAKTLPRAAAEYVAEGLKQSSVPDEAYSSAMAVITRAHEQAWSASETEQALRAALSIDSAETFLTAGAPVVKRDENGKPIYRATADLDTGGMNWYARMQQEARTSVTGLWGILESERMKQEGAATKRWVTRHDERVRDPHAEADGQTVPVDMPFTVDGYPMMYPGDRSAPYYLTVNCRCVTISPDDAVGLGTPPPPPDFATILEGASDSKMATEWFNNHFANIPLGKDGARASFSEVWRGEKGTVFFTGTIKDANGKVVGNFERMIEGDSAKHVEFVLKEAARRQGIATDLNAEFDRIYEAMGVDNIRLQAALKDGGYVWAKAGYDWDVREASTDYGLSSVATGARFAKRDHADPEVLAYLDDIDAKARATTDAYTAYAKGEGEWATVESAYAAMPKPWEIANKSFPSAPNLGAEILRGSNWHGVKQL